MNGDNTLGEITSIARNSQGKVPPSRIIVSTYGGEVFVPRVLCFTNGEGKTGRNGNGGHEDPFGDIFYGPGDELYMVDSDDTRVVRVGSDEEIQTVAGGNGPGDAANHGWATRPSRGAHLPSSPSSRAASHL